MVAGPGREGRRCPRDRRRTRSELANTALPLIVTDAVPVTDERQRVASRRRAASMVPVNLADHPLALTPGGRRLAVPGDSAMSGTVPVAAGVPVSVVLL